MTAGVEVADDPVRLRRALVRTLVDAGWLDDPRVVAVLETVPRHVFVPGVPVRQAYENDVVHTKFDVDGRPISAASQPRIVAMMLQQAQVRAGDRVLEIGAGTGYNAALLAELAGPGGRVTTVDVDADLVDVATANLAAAGYRSVQVVCGDGALGYPPGAPFDVVIATVGAWDVPSVWLGQVADGGRLVVPQRLRGGVSRSVVYQRDATGGWESTDSQMCGFMPLRDGIADDPHRTLDLAGDGRVWLDVYQEQHPDSVALVGVLERPRRLVRTGVWFGGQESLEWLWLWLACVLPDGFSGLHTDQVTRAAMVAPYGVWTLATTHGAALAYLTVLDPASDVDRGDGHRVEVAVVGHGRGSDALVDQMVEQVRCWNGRYRERPVRFAIAPADSAPEPDGGGEGRFAFAMPAGGHLTIGWHDAAH